MRKQLSKFYFQRLLESPLSTSLSSSGTLFFQYPLFSGASSVSAFPLHPPIGSEQSLMLPIFKIKQRKYSDLSLQTSPTLFLFPETTVYNMFCLHFLTSHPPTTTLHLSQATETALSDY